MKLEALAVSEYVPAAARPIEYQPSASVVVLPPPLTCTVAPEIGFPVVAFTTRPLTAGPDAMDGAVMRIDGGVLKVCADGQPTWVGGAATAPATLRIVTSPLSDGA